MNPAYPANQYCLFAEAELTCWLCRTTGCKHDSFGQYLDFFGPEMQDSQQTDSSPLNVDFYGAKICPFGITTKGSACLVCSSSGKPYVSCQSQYLCNLLRQYCSNLFFQTGTTACPRFFLWMFAVAICWGVLLTDNVEHHASRNTSWCIHRVFFSLLPAL